MFKTLTFIVLFAAAIFSLGRINANPSKKQLTEVNTQLAGCDDYFVKVTIGDRIYLYEYSCDGSIVNITEIYE